MKTDYEVSQLYLNAIDDAFDDAMDALLKISRNVNQIGDIQFGKPSNLSGYVFEGTVTSFRKMLKDIKDNVFKDYRSSVEYDYPAPPEEEEGEE